VRGAKARDALNTKRRELPMDSVRGTFTVEDVPAADATTVTLSGTVTAADIICPAEVEIINPDLADRLNAAGSKQGSGWLSRLTGRWLK